MNDYNLGYIHGRYGGLSFARLMLAIGVIALFGFFGSQNRKHELKTKATEHNKCHRILVDAGYAAVQIKELTDGQVAAECGFLPKEHVNSTWHRDRERPVGVAEKSSEYMTCAEKFLAQGLTYEDLAQSSDVEVAIICDFVPAHHPSQF